MCVLISFIISANFFSLNSTSEEGFSVKGKLGLMRHLHHLDLKPEKNGSGESELKRFLVMDTGIEPGSFEW